VARGHRETGTRVLLAGAGTSGRRVAEALAAETKRELRYVDLNAVVSKNIGETEKNLARLFADAEARGAVLFFDEADALFGRRSDVKDSHDRYANVDTDRLLKRIESYRGLVVVSTKAPERSPDTARRFLHVLRFPPD
jgi:SpoVK/Ycf46/Vps4 family AAA+-type ATPase